VKTTRILPLIVCSLTALAGHSYAASTLIDHDFTDGTAGNLNGELVDGGTLQTGALAWTTIADLDSQIFRDGAITTEVSATNQSAFIGLGNAITNGKIYELSVTFSGLSGPWVGAGFFDQATPTATNNHDGGGGTGWFLWRGNNTRVEPNIGLNYDKNGDGYSAGGRTNYSASGPTETFTIQLDLSAANGVDNWGNMTLYDGDSTTGTIIGGLSNVAFDDSQNFRSVGFSALRSDATISQFTLTQIPEPSSFALISGLFGLGYIISRRRRR
jgi:hypothetical protein